MKAIVGTFSRNRTLACSHRRRIVLLAVALVFGMKLLLSGGIAANAQVTPIPFSSVAVGLPPGTGAKICAAAFNSIGDGCPGTQASISKTQAAWGDRYGNVYFVDYTSSHEVRVLYQGGASLAALITANNPAVTSPQFGYVYAIAGSTTTTVASTSSTCAGSSAAIALDTAGDGCPGYQAWTQPTGGYTDANGDVYLADRVPSAMIRIVYAGGAAAARLIALESGVSSPVVGNIYRVGGASNGAGGYDGDGGLASSAHLHSVESLVVNSSGDIYIADTANNAIRAIDGATGIISTIAGTSCTTGSTGTYGCTAGYNSDGVLATSAELKAPYEVAVDSNGNLYIADSGNNRIRVIYFAGSLVGIGSPVPGYIYTIAGGGTSTSSGISPLNIGLDRPYTVALSPSGDLYVGNSFSPYTIYRIDASTGVATVFAGDKQATWTVGSYCSGGSGGPMATDTVGDGCPATQSALVPQGRLSFAPNGVSYIADFGNGLIRAYEFNHQFPATTVGASSILQVAVTSPNSSSTFAAPSIDTTVQGTSTSDFSTGNGDCTAGTSYPAGTVCTYNLQFTPAQPGRRAGGYVLTQGNTAVATQGLEGDGLAPLLAVNFGVTTKVASSIASVQSIATDMLGGLYLSDASTGKLWKMTGTTSTPAAILTGLNQPAQSAVDGVGNVYVADTGNNQIVELTASGSTVKLLAGLAGPLGVAVTGAGALYISDTGNNRILCYADGVLSQLPVTGLSAPSALVLAANDDLFIADTGNQRVVKYTRGIQTAIAFGSAQVEPVGLAVDPAGDVYVADKLSGSVLRLAPGASSAAALASGLGSPSGIGLDPAGNLFYADNLVAGFDEVAQQQGVIAFPNTSENQSSTSVTATIENIGNAGLTFPSSPGYMASGYTSDFSLKAGTSGCGTAALAPASTCTLAATFTPFATGSFTETVTFQSTAANTGTAFLTLSGKGVLALPTVSAWPTAGAITYGQTLTSSILTGGAASVPGAFEWESATTQPKAGTQSETVIFVPQDTTSYGTVSQSVVVVVKQAMPIVSAWPSAGGIAFGQTLASSTLTGGSASVSGTFAWITPTIVPAQGTSSNAVVFTPQDTTDYTTVSGQVSVVVNKPAPTVTAWPSASAIVYGQTLAHSTLTGGTASVPGAFAWATPAAMPGAGAPMETVTFTPQDTTNYSTVNGTIAVTVRQASLTVTANNATKVFGSANPAFNGTVSGAVNGDTFTQSFVTTATQSSPVSTYTIVPSVSGTNVSDYTVNAANGALTITQAASSVALTANATSVTLGQAVILTATVADASTGSTGTPSGAVTFLDGATQLGVGTLTGGTASLTVTTLLSGTYSLTAVYAGDVNFTGSSVISPATVAVGGDFTLAPASSNLSAEPGGTASTSIIVTPSDGVFADAVTLSVTGLPPGAIAAFSPAGRIPANTVGTPTVTMTIQLPQALASNQESLRWPPLAPLVLALMVVPWAATRRLRKSLAGRLAMLGALTLAGTAGAASLSGCSANQGFNATPVQNYTLTVIAAGGTSTHSLQIDLKVQ